jgi:Family of unknown function (DUF6519)
MTNPDISKNSFKENKHFDKVIFQLGKPVLDSELNENTDIIRHMIRKSANEIIGKCGTSDEQAFKICTKGYPYTFWIGQGFYFIDGILYENSKPITVYNQADLPSLGNCTPCPSKEGLHIVYLDGMEKEITMVEDPQIMERALEGLDTAARSKNVIQVKTKYLPPRWPQDCCKLLENDYWKSLLTDDICSVGNPLGTLAARTRKGVEPKDPCCDLALEGGYTGQDNRLYRIEIYDGKNKTFRFSDDNASTSSRVLGIEGNKIVISISNKDRITRYERGNWFEMRDVRNDLWLKPGPMSVLLDVRTDGSKCELYFDPEVDGASMITNESFPQKFIPRITKWKSGPKQIDTKDIDLDGFIHIGDGIQVKFEGDKFVRSSFWRIQALSLERGIEWPVDKQGNPIQVPAEGVYHHYCLLAVIRYTKGEVIFEWDKAKSCKEPAKDLKGLFDFIENKLNDKDESIKDVIYGNLNLQNCAVLDQYKNQDSINLFDGSNKISLRLNDDGNVLLEINDIIVHIFLKNNNKVHLGQIEVVSDCRDIFPKLTQLSPLFCTTGIIDIERLKRKKIYGPIYHNLECIRLPPMVLIGLVSKVSEQEQITSIYSHYDKSMRFEAINIDKEKFFIYLEDQGSENRRILQLRFWAFAPSAPSVCIPSQKAPVYSIGGATHENKRTKSSTRFRKKARTTK